MYLCMDKKYDNSSFHYFALFLMCILSLVSCKQKTQTDPTIESGALKTLPGDFIEFYKSFHQDSIYQLLHITFPLAGKMQDISGRDSIVTWIAENWILHKSITPDDFWAVDFTIPMEGTIMEFIHARNAGYYMERRFAKLGNEWHLIYYSGMQSANNSEAEIDSLIESGEIEIE